MPLQPALEHKLRESSEEELHPFPGIARRPNAVTQVQGDKEKASRLPVSPLMDRAKDGVSKSQCDFLSKVALPMFEAWAAVFPRAAPMVANTEANLKLWKGVQAAKGGRRRSSRIRTAG